MDGVRASVRNLEAAALASLPIRRQGL